MKYKFFFTLGSFLLLFSGYSQNKDKKLLEGNKLYEQYGYFDAIKIYEKVANKGYKSVELFEKLGNSNFFNGLYIDANKWYSQLFALNQEVEPIYYYRYSQTLKTVGEFVKSNEFLLKFSQMNSKNSISTQYENNKNYLDVLDKKPIRYTIENAEINSSSSDYGASLFEGNIIFTSTRKNDINKDNKIDPWTKDYYTSLYFAKLSEELKLSDAQFFSKEIETQYHESTAVFSKDGKTMYFTKSDDLEKKKKLRLNRKMLLKIYTATLKDGKWGDVTSLGINSDLYNCVHPALSPDEKTLYFVSDMPGGYGDSDLYRVRLEGKNTIGAIENLGGNINTTGKETFPFVSDKNKLYFSSDGHLGLGGLDVFVVDILNGDFSDTISNLGKPINSSFDDFAYFKLVNSNIGFFTSNRTGGSGKDDIYRFVEQEEVEDVLIMKDLMFVDKDTQKPISGLVVSLYDGDHNLVKVLQANSEGKYSTTIEKPKKALFYIEIAAPEFEKQEVAVDGSKRLIENSVFQFSKKMVSLHDGLDLSKVFIDPILFDLDKYNITKGAEVELQKAIEFMKQYPDLMMEIRAHTDSRKDFDYNIKLSDHRAKAVMKYIVENGVSKVRLSTKALGESQLLNNCSDGVLCNEQQHAINRRCEFIILSKKLDINF